jgi:hypothetical protein
MNLLTRLLPLAAAALLAACGPGVGGSGTGLEPPLPPGAANLPTPSLHTDGTDGRQVQAVLEGGRLRVNAACPRLRFEGLWDARSDTPLRFEGSLEGAGAATAEVQLAGSTLTVTLRDGAGRVLLGPLPLGAVVTLPPLGGC